MGIEPTLSAWKAEALPLNYTRKDYWRLRELALFQTTVGIPIALWFTNKILLWNFLLHIYYIIFFKYYQITIKWCRQRESNPQPTDSLPHLFPVVVWTFSSPYLMT